MQRESGYCPEEAAGANRRSTATASFKVTPIDVVPRDGAARVDAVEQALKTVRIDGEAAIRHIQLHHPSDSPVISKRAVDPRRA